MKLGLYFFATFCAIVVVGKADIGVDPNATSKELTLEKLEFFVHNDQGKYILEKEFESIKGGKRRPWTVAELPENLPKNRYDDLLAFDETRVVLEPRSYDESDYINANYVDGYYKDKEYVATQGPLPNTTRDFWAMIWQLNVSKIVMLANLIEHGEMKVVKYWPDDVGTYDDIIVTRLSEKVIPEIQHVIRTFSVRKVGVIPPRVVRQFHFTGWPDLGVPKDRLSVIALLEQVRKYKPDCEAPIVIHCSAGVGRTGTVMLIDSMIEKARTEGMVDFPLKLDQMRVQRVDAVEKKDQYIFAHEAVYDYFNGTDTEEYLRKVDNLYRAGDNSMFRNDFQVPHTLEDSLQQIKAYNHRMGVLIEVAQQKYEEETKTIDEDDK